jgi:hypothetical protein
MKKIILISLALVLSLSAFSQTEGIGIGVKLGTTVDFTAKFWMGEKTALDLSAGFDYGGFGGLHLSADYLIHNWSFDIAHDEGLFRPRSWSGFSYRLFQLLLGHLFIFQSLVYYSGTWRGRLLFSRLPA